MPDVRESGLLEGTYDGRLEKMLSFTEARIVGFAPDRHGSTGSTPPAAGPYRGTTHPSRGIERVSRPAGSHVDCPRHSMTHPTPDATGSRRPDGPTYHSRQRALIDPRFQLKYTALL